MRQFCTATLAEKKRIFAVITITIERATNDSRPSHELWVSNHVIQSKGSRDDDVFLDIYPLGARDSWRLELREREIKDTYNRTRVQKSR